MPHKNGPYPWYKLPAVTSLCQLIESQAEKAPDQPAFVWTDKKQEVIVTRAQFLKQCQALACWMIENDLADSHIAIAASNSYWWILVFSACQFCHSAAVPINPELSDAEIAGLVKQADCKALFYSRSCKDVLELEVMKDVMAIDISKVKELAETPVSARLLAGYPEYPDTLSAIFFTSGTTGKAKGVMLTQKNFASDINASCATFRFDGWTVALLPFYHSFGLMTSVYMALNWNGTVYIAKNMRRILQDMAAASPQTLCVVPLVVETIHKRITESLKKSGQYKQVRSLMKVSRVLEKMGIDMRHTFFKKIQEQFGGKLEYIICGGAMLDEEMIQDFHDWGIQILRGYGITEGSPVLCVNRNHFIKPDSVGPLMPGVRGKVSPEGELLFAGDMICQGYWKEPEMSAEAIENGWLHTGDLGHIDEDNFVFITGRSKNLIILSNGENVSPEQIEQILLRDEGVCECVVLGKNGHLEARIFPEQDYLGNEEYFKNLIDAYNQSQPSTRTIVKFTLRDEEFEKNAMQKILRNRID